MGQGRVRSGYCLVDRRLEELGRCGVDCPEPRASGIVSAAVMCTARRKPCQLEHPRTDCSQLISNSGKLEQFPGEARVNTGEMENE